MSHSPTSPNTLLNTLQARDLVVLDLPVPDQNLKRPGRSHTEIGYQHPALVVSTTAKAGRSSRFAHVLVVPFTSIKTLGQEWGRDRPDLYVHFPSGTGKSTLHPNQAGLQDDSYLLWDQLRMVDPSRILRILGKLSTSDWRTAILPLLSQEGPFDGLLYKIVQDNLKAKAPSKGTR